MSRRDSCERPIDRIAPDFADRWDADTPEEALEKAEAASSSTPREQMPRCIRCGSVRLTPKPGMLTAAEHRIDTAYKCTHCGHHADERAPPAAEAPDYDFETMIDINTDFVWADSDDLEHPGVRHRRTIRGLTDTERDELAIRLYRPWTDDGPSYRELASLFSHSHEWIGRRVRAWRDGEYRDVCPGPWPTVDRSSVESTSPTVEAE